MAGAKSNGSSNRARRGDVVFEMMPVGMVASTKRSKYAKPKRTSGGALFFS